MTPTLHTRTNPPVLRVLVTGELDLSAAADLRAIIVEGIAAGCTDVAVELSGVTFIDCTGLAALLAGQDEVRATGGQLVLENTSCRVRRLLDLTRTAARFELAATA